MMSSAHRTQLCSSPRVWADTSNHMVSRKMSGFQTDIPVRVSSTAAPFGKPMPEHKGQYLLGTMVLHFRTALPKMVSFGMYYLPSCIVLSCVHCSSLVVKELCSCRRVDGSRLDR
jgi:hypothetical protein